MAEGLTSPIAAKVDHRDSLAALKKREGLDLASGSDSDDNLAQADANTDQSSDDDEIEEHGRQRASRPRPIEDSITMGNSMRP